MFALLLIGSAVWVAADPFAGHRDTGSRQSGAENPGTEELASRELQGGDGGPINVLVLGVDRRPNSHVEGAGTRTDTIMVAQVDPETGQIKLLSIPRDFLVEISPGEQQRINTAYNYGGASRTIAVIEYFAEIPIDHYAVVDFKGFEKVIDAMGGVTIDVEGTYPPGYRMEEGVQTLDGRQALLYARYRSTPRGDLDRIDHQQQMVAALRSQALRWDTVTELPRIAKVIKENVETDVGPGEAIALGRTLMQRGPGAQMTAEQLEGTPKTLENGDQVLVPDEAQNEPILQDFRR